MSFGKMKLECLVDDRTTLERDGGRTKLLSVKTSVRRGWAQNVGYVVLVHQRVDDSHTEATLLDTKRCIDVDNQTRAIRETLIQHDLLVERMCAEHGCTRRAP